MRNFYVDNLCLEVPNNEISSNIIESTFKEIYGINNLYIENVNSNESVSFVLKVLNYIIENKILVSNLILNIDGIYYSEEFNEILKDFYNYITKYNKSDKVISINLKDSNNKEKYEKDFNILDDNHFILKDNNDDSNFIFGEDFALPIIHIGPRLVIDSMGFIGNSKSNITNINILNTNLLELSKDKNILSFEEYSKLCLDFFNKDSKQM